MISSGKEGDFYGRRLYMRIEYPRGSFMVPCGMSAYPILLFSFLYFTIEV